MANLYDERGDYDRALRHYHEAVRLHPGYADAHYNLALLYQGSGQVMEAVRHWKMYLKLDPGSSWAPSPGANSKSCAANGVDRQARGLAVGSRLT